MHFSRKDGSEYNPLERNVRRKYKMKKYKTEVNSRRSCRCHQTQRRACTASKCKRNSAQGNIKTNWSSQNEWKKINLLPRQNTSLLSAFHVTRRRQTSPSCWQTCKNFWILYIMFVKYIRNCLLFLLPCLTKLTRRLQYFYNIITKYFGYTVVI